MVACSRRELLSTKPGYLPRVTHKIGLTIRPEKIIERRAVEISRLNNEMLNECDLFNEKDTDLINAFLKRLAEPACFVAHNGFTFDFKHLDSHFKRIGQEFGRQFISIDSLNIFRHIDSKYERHDLRSLCERHLEGHLEYLPCLNSAEDKALALLYCVIVRCNEFISAAEL